eukprot:sb/3460613/
MFSDFSSLSEQVSRLHALSCFPASNAVVHCVGDVLPDLTLKFNQSAMISNLVLLYFKDKDVYIVLENILNSLRSRINRSTGQMQTSAEVNLYCATRDLIDWNDLIKDDCFVEVLSHFFPDRQKLVIIPCSTSTPDMCGFYTSLVITSGLLINGSLPLEDFLSTDDAFKYLISFYNNCKVNDRPIIFQPKSRFFYLDPLDFFDKNEKRLSSNKKTMLSYKPTTLPNSHWCISSNKVPFEPAHKIEPAFKRILSGIEELEALEKQCDDELKNRPSLDEVVAQCVAESDKEYFASLESKHSEIDDEDAICFDSTDLPIFDYSETHTSSCKSIDNMPTNETRQKPNQNPPVTVDRSSSSPSLKDVTSAVPVTPQLSTSWRHGSARWGDDLKITPEQSNPAQKPNQNPPVTVDRSSSSPSLKDVTSAVPVTPQLSTSWRHGSARWGDDLKITPEQSNPAQKNNQNPLVTVDRSRSSPSLKDEPSAVPVTAQLSTSWRHGSARWGDDLKITPEQSNPAQKNNQNPLVTVDRSRSSPSLKDEPSAVPVTAQLSTSWRHGSARWGDDLKITPEQSNPAQKNNQNPLVTVDRSRSSPSLKDEPSAVPVTAQLSTSWRHGSARWGDDLKITPEQSNPAQKNNQNPLVTVDRSRSSPSLKDEPSAVPVTAQLSTSWRHGSARWGDDLKITPEQSNPAQKNNQNPLVTVDRSRSSPSLKDEPSAVPVTAQLSTSWRHGSARWGDDLKITPEQSNPAQKNNQNPLVTVDRSRSSPSLKDEPSAVPVTAQLSTSWRHGSARWGDDLKITPEQSNPAQKNNQNPLVTVDRSRSSPSLKDVTSAVPVTPQLSTSWRHGSARWGDDLKITPEQSNPEIQQKYVKNTYKSRSLKIVSTPILCNQLDTNCITRKLNDGKTVHVQHFHCPNCTITHRSESRIVSHMKSCLSKTNTGQAIKACKNQYKDCYTKKDGSSRVHYHCHHCKYTQLNLKTVTKHMESCLPSTLHETKPLFENVQLVCPKTSTFLVRKNYRGPTTPHHVQISSKRAICEKCHNAFDGCDDIICEHIEACLQYNAPSVVKDLINESSDFSQFGNEKNLKLTCRQVSSDQRIVCSRLLPHNDSQFVYYSVAEDSVHHFSKLKRVVVTLDRRTSTLSCQCNTNRCSHKKIVTVATSADTVIQKPRQSDQHVDKEVEKCNRQVKYLLDYKRISSFGTSSDPQSCDVIEPIETDCVYCKVKLNSHTSHSNGVLFCLNKIRSKKFQVRTKICPSCLLVYKYAEQSDGIFNFNNSAFFSMKLLDFTVNMLINGTSLEKLCLSIKSSNMDICNSNLLLDATKAYLALNDCNFSENMSCYRCGYYPSILTYDTIRSTCFNLQPKNVVDQSESHHSFQEMLESCEKRDLSRCFLPRNCHKFANMSQFNAKLTPSLPPLVGPHNQGVLKNSTRDDIINDRPEDLYLPAHKLESMFDSKESYDRLKKFCQKHKIDCQGGKAYMVQRLIDCNKGTKLWTSVQKNFLSLKGKSGGILRAFCPHGVCYALKFLTLPESVADYTQILTYFRVPPTINTTDMASLLAVHTNNHYHNFFNPYLGRIAHPSHADSELYKSKEKEFVFDLTSSKEKGIGNCDEFVPYHVYSMYDKFHQHNHREPDRHLRSFDNTQLNGHINTSIAEQQNFIISLNKSSINEMCPETFIKFVTFLCTQRNASVNRVWKKCQEKKQRCKYHVDEQSGVLVKEHTENQSQPPSKKIKVTHDLSVRSVLVASSTIPNTCTTVTNRKINYSLLGSSESGRLKLTMDHGIILESPSEWYDDIIMESYANMCINSFPNIADHQLTLHCQNFLFSQPTKPFVQIMFFDKHWFCISNVLSGPCSLASARGPILPPPNHLPLKMFIFQAFLLPLNGKSKSRKKIFLNFLKIFENSDSATILIV